MSTLFVHSKNLGLAWAFRGHSGHIRITWRSAPVVRNVPAVSREQSGQSVLDPPARRSKTCKHSLPFAEVKVSLFPSSAAAIFSFLPAARDY